MSSEAIQLLSVFGIAVVLVLIAGFYCVLTTKNLIRLLIGVEILTKAATLLIIVAGNATGQVGLAQALAITMIIIEVSVIVVAISIVLCIHRNNRSIDATLLREIKG